MSRNRSSADALSRRQTSPRLFAFALALSLGGCASFSGQLPPQAPATDKAAAPSLVEQADSARAEGDLARAANLYRSVHLAEPHHLEPLMRLGATYVAMQAYPEALRTYRAAAALRPGDADVLWRLSQMLLVENRPQEALATLAKLQPSRRNDPRLYNARGVAEALLGKYELAERDFRTGLGIAPDHIGLCDNLGLTQFLAGDYAAAVTTIERVAALPQAKRARQNLAMIFALHGDFSAASAMAGRDLDAAAVAAAMARYRALAKTNYAEEGAALFGVHLNRAGAAIGKAAPPRTARSAVDARPAADERVADNDRVEAGLADAPKAILPPPMPARAAAAPAAVAVVNAATPLPPPRWE